MDPRDEMLSHSAAPPVTGAWFREVRDRTVDLTEPLEAEDLCLQAAAEVSPPKWHLAHTTWFFEEFILKHQMPGYQEFDPNYGYLFNSYYVTVGSMHPRPQRGLLSRPVFSEILRYRRHVDEGILALSEREDVWRTVAPMVELGLHHEQQHQELLVTDTKYNLSRNPLGPAYLDAPTTGRPAADVPAHQWVPLEPGVYEVGAEDGGFAYDNERPRHRVYMNPVEIGSRLVTNAEYAEFVQDGGYERPELWLEDGWRTRQEHEWRSPLYWRKDSDGEWHLYTVTGWQDLPANEPVCHVSYYEADAYARWRGVRLPTEFEWEVAADGARGGDGSLFEDGSFHPQPAGNDHGGLVQMRGDVWEWTGSPYAPYPGFQPLAGSLGEYNGKFMCNQMVLRGGSCATSRSHFRDTYRNFFPPDARWQFMGIRLARDPRLKHTPFR